MSSTINAYAIDKLLSDAVTAGAVPHVAAIAADRDGVIYEGAAGPRITGESGDPVTTSTVFRIMSMTKMVAMTAALQQVERGELDLGAPVDTYLPEFAEVRVLEGFDGDTPRLRAPASRATVRQLVTHTAGLGYWFWNEELARYQRVTGTPHPLSGKADAFKAPMLFDPGARFNYGISFDWLGKVIEAVAGKGLDVVVKENISGPLGMNDTMFLLDGGRRPVPSPTSTRRTGGLPGTACRPRRGTTYASSGCCCAAASWTVKGSCGRRQSTRRSVTRSAISASPATFRPPNRGHLRVDLHELGPVPHHRCPEALRRFRSGAVRRAVGLCCTVAGHRPRRDLASRLNDEAGCTRV
jgi:CubicO group peptidase (beta-lactamase class C family)